MCYLVFFVGCPPARIAFNSGAAAVVRGDSVDRQEGLKFKLLTVNILLNSYVASLRWEGAEQ